MAATRLSDGQKRELVERFRGGESAQALALAYGCSAATVTRAVKAGLDAAEYERLRPSGGRRPGGAAAVVETSGAGALGGSAAPAEPPGRPPADDRADDPTDERADDPTDELADDRGDDRADDERAEAHGVLAIDDADDFGDDQDEDLLEDDADDGLDGGDEANLFVAVAPVIHVDDHAAAEPVPLLAASLPASAYMLVDKTVELQARPLSEFPELGRLSPEEAARQALVVFANPRQARRQCGRSQRVIKLPDLRVLELSAPYLLAQGISRVVMEGALYSLPGS